MSSTLPVANRADVYVLAKVNSVLLRPVERGEICGVFAGLRLLVAADDGADTTRMSREHRLFWPLPGLTAIAGGKYDLPRDGAGRGRRRGARPRPTVPSTTDRVPLSARHRRTITTRFACGTAPVRTRCDGWWKPTPR